MFRSAVVLLRAPMIQFRHGVREASTVAAPAAAAAATKAAPPAATTAQPAAVVLDSVWDLPANLRPKVISEAEITAVRFGGASPYPPPKDKKKK